VASVIGPLSFDQTEKRIDFLRGYEHYFVKLLQIANLLMNVLSVNLLKFIVNRRIKILILEKGERARLISEIELS